MHKKYKHLEAEHDLVRNELEGRVVSAAASAAADTNEVSALRTKIIELETEVEQIKTNRVSNKIASEEGDHNNSASNLQQELFFCKAQLEQTQQEKASREELLLDAKKQLLACQGERKRTQRSLNEAETALSAADAGHDSEFNGMTMLRNVAYSKGRAMACQL